MCTRIIYFIKIATYDVAVLGIRFRYFMVHKFNPRTNTFTWTLDYDRSSNFDDNVGHWQVMKHPSKNGWSRYAKEYTSTEWPHLEIKGWLLLFDFNFDIRVVYSCQVKLFSWVPGLVIKFLTKTAILEATQWVKKESELAESIKSKSKKSWFVASAITNTYLYKTKYNTNSDSGHGVCPRIDISRISSRFASLISFKSCKIHKIWWMSNDVNCFIFYYLEWISLIFSRQFFDILVKISVVRFSSNGK